MAGLLTMQIRPHTMDRRRPPLHVRNALCNQSMVVDNLSDVMLTGVAIIYHTPPPQAPTVIMTTTTTTKSQADDDDEAICCFSYDSWRGRGGNLLIALMMCYREL